MIMLATKTAIITALLLSISTIADALPSTHQHSAWDQDSSKLPLPPQRTNKVRLVEQKGEPLQRRGCVFSQEGRRGSQSNNADSQQSPVQLHHRPTVCDRQTFRQEATKMKDRAMRQHPSGSQESLTIKNNGKNGMDPHRKSTPQKVQQKSMKQDEKGKSLIHDNEQGGKTGMGKENGGNKREGAKGEDVGTSKGGRLYYEDTIVGEDGKERQRRVKMEGVSTISERVAAQYGGNLRRNNRFSGQGKAEGKGKGKMHEGLS